MPAKPVKRQVNEEPTVPVEESGVFPEIEVAEALEFGEPELVSQDEFVELQQAASPEDLPSVSEGFLRPVVRSEAPRETYSLSDPQGIIHVTEDLYQFCEIHGLNGPAMVECASGQLRQYKGWSVRRIS